MTRKRYIKLLMAAGADRNTVNTQARLNRKHGYAYSETVEEDAKKYRVLTAFHFHTKDIPVTIRPYKRRKKLDGLRAQWAFVDETPLIPDVIQKKVAEEIKKNPPHLEMATQIYPNGRIKRIYEVSLVASGGYPLGGMDNE